MVKHDITECELSAQHTDMDCLRIMCDLKKGIRHNDTLEFTNGVKCTFDFIPDEMAVVLKGIKGVKPVKRNECKAFLYFFTKDRKRYTIEEDYDKIVYGLFVEDAACYLKHGDLLSFSTKKHRYSPGYFVYIDIQKRVLYLVPNRATDSNHAVIPLDVSHQVGSAIDYFRQMYDNLSEPMMEICDCDKMVSILLHPKLVKYGKDFTINLIKDAIIVEYKGVENRFLFSYGMMKNADSLQDLWSLLPDLTSDDTILESSEYKDLMSTKMKDGFPRYSQHVKEIIANMIRFNIDLYKTVKASRSTEQSPTDKGPIPFQDKVLYDVGLGRVHEEQYVMHDMMFLDQEKLLGTTIHKIFDNNLIHIDSITVRVLGRKKDIRSSKSQIQDVVEEEGYDVGEAPDAIKHKCLTPPPGKVLNPDTCNFIDANGALAKKLGLSVKVSKVHKVPDAHNIIEKPKKSKKVVEEKAEKPKNTKTKKKIEVDGKIILFSGFRDATLEKDIINAGGRVKNNYAKDVTLVVATDVGGTTAKLTKARTDGKRIVSRDYFEKRFYAP